LEFEHLTKAALWGGLFFYCIRCARKTPDIVFEGNVDFSEMLGEEVRVHVTSGVHKYIISINPHQAAGRKEDAIRLPPSTAAEGSDR